MKAGDIVKLEVGLQKILDPFRLIEELVVGKQVLNVGAAGGVHGYLPANKDIWLHERLRRSANKLIGVDIDEVGISYAKEYGYDILMENCETMDLGKKFDVIVMSDVIEHVNAPVVAIRNLLSHLDDGGRLIITTPNALSGNICLRSLIRKDVNVFWDHVTTYYPEHFQAICDRLRCKLEAVYMFDHVDRRSIETLMKSMVFRLMTTISLRLASSMLVVIRK